jgi:hypothetical protein
LTAWDELLDEFRVLGGTADNIRLGHGEFGRGLFPVDPALPVAVHVPGNLLVAVKDMVFTGGVPHVGPNAKTGEREKAWLDLYQREFAWGGGGGDEIRRTFEMAGALPAELRHQLLTEYRCGVWFKEPTDELIANQFFGARSITYREGSVVMPLVEMANHGSGANYDTSNGIALRGTFSDEVLVEYSLLDSFDFFLSWGFATQRPVAFSVALSGKIDSTPLTIGQKFMGMPTKSEREWIPKMEANADTVTLPFLMIGNRQFPRLPKGIFYRLMRDAGFGGFEETFDLVHHLNRLHFINLLQKLEGIDLPIGRTLRAMAHCQLRAMSFCFGVREI